ncbi:hypothetical protein ABH915_003014 [Arthrobacter sp. MW3 TE3886]
MVLTVLRVDRRVPRRPPLATVVSQPTINDGEGRDAKDFRYRSEHTMTDDELRTYFKH